MEEWGLYIPYFTNLEWIALWVRPIDTLARYHTFLRQWFLKFNSERLAVVVIMHRNWWFDCRTEVLCMWSLENEALTTPNDLHLVTILSEVDELAPESSLYDAAEGTFLNEGEEAELYEDEVEAYEGEVYDDEACDEEYAEGLLSVSEINQRLNWANEMTSALPCRLVDHNNEEEELDEDDVQVQVEAHEGEVYDDEVYDEEYPAGLLSASEIKQHILDWANEMTSAPPCRLTDDISQTRNSNEHKGGTSGDHEVTHMPSLFE
ncbi:hypothetical protein EST38_g10154 [Candolleomyces aberdarensis]|uniref:Uncharacterized protein n=1 Tax=Candolleomyces aberdarensis TaxID=2316362 RepID=A0A4V1Q2N4_9AGAR|nr:hypothetical protein EST38_g10154 [Candolleomyces aberdarensis]